MSWKTDKSCILLQFFSIVCVCGWVIIGYFDRQDWNFDDVRKIGYWPSLFEVKVNENIPPKYVFKILQQYAKRVKVKSPEFLGWISTFRKVTGEKQLWIAFLIHNPCPELGYNLIPTSYFVSRVSFLFISFGGK